MTQKKKFKTILIFMSTILCCFFMAGMVLTFVLKAKQNDLLKAKQQNAQLELEYQKMKQEHDYKCTRNDEHDIEECMISMGYNSDYWKNENGYGTNGDKIIK